jgi:DNA invertase Pin-like site-specific DNA recombinase
LENQNDGIRNYAATAGLSIDQWIDEVISGTKRSSERQLGKMLQQAKKDDIIIISELSRLGRSIMDVMSILRDCIDRGIHVHSIKEKFVLQDDISTKVIAFAFSLAAELERDLISQRTKDALSRKKSQGFKLGRPVGSRNKVNKLTGKENEIKRYLSKNVSVSAIAKLCEVNRHTVRKYIRSMTPTTKP